MLFSNRKFNLIFLGCFPYCPTTTSYLGGWCAACHSSAVCAGVTLTTCGACCCCGGAPCVVVVAMTTGEARRRRCRRPEEVEVTVTAAPEDGGDDTTTTLLRSIMRWQRRHGRSQVQGRSRVRGPWRWWHSHWMFTCCTSWIVAISFAVRSFFVRCAFDCDQTQSMLCIYNEHNLPAIS